MATFTGYPASYNSTYSSHGGDYNGYPNTNPLGMGSSNGTYAQWYLNEGSGAETYIYYDFDLSEIPQNATIDSVSCTAKAYIGQTNSSRVATRQIQLRNGRDNPVGSASTISTSTSALTLSCGTWTREMLNECGICIYIRRGTSSTTSNYYTRLYGATLTVEYTVQSETTYRYTATASVGGTISPTSGVIKPGTSVSFDLSAYDGYELHSITANGSSVPFETTTISGVENGISLIHCDNSINDELGGATVTSRNTTFNQTAKFGSHALYFNNNGYVKIDMGSAEAYTLEFWFQRVGSNTYGWYPTLFSTASYGTAGGTYMHIDDGSYGQYPVCRSNARNSTTNNGGYGSTIIQTGRWYHFAYCKNGSNHLFFVDGILQRTVSQSNPNSNNVFYLGCLFGSSAPVNGCYFQGYIDEILISNTVKYTANFTPPTSQFAAQTRQSYSCTVDNIQEDMTIYASFVIAGQSNTILRIKQNGAWQTVTAAYRKVNGAWVELDEAALAALINSTTRYKLIN